LKDEHLNHCIKKATPLKRLNQPDAGICSIALALTSLAMVPAADVLDSKEHWLAMSSPVSWGLSERITRTAFARSSVPLFEAVFFAPRDKEEFADKDF
jgi:hypothetical protein